MSLYKNGFVVAEINTGELIYNAWPLSDLLNDKMAELLTEEADISWFMQYDMQHIAPDSGYIKKYLDYCNSIKLKVKVLLFESLNNTIVVDDKFEICEVLGFDCIGSVYFSYLQTEYKDYELDLSKKNIALNKHGLLDKLEDVLYFIELRKKYIADGISLEDFWEELPVRISIVNII